MNGEEEKKERHIAIKCWNCKKKFTVSVKPTDEENAPQTLLLTCPFCGKENEIKAKGFITDSIRIYRVIGEYEGIEPSQLEEE